MSPAGTGKEGSRARRASSLPKPGSKNKLTGEVKQSIAAFFTACTSDNVRWRQRVSKILDGAGTTQDFHKWSLTALDRTLGTPAKAAIEKPRAPSLTFAMTHGYLPWDPAVDPCREKAEQMIAAKKAAELALESGKKGPAGEVVIDATADKAEEAAGEPLELVRLPEPPEPFNPPPRERDRGR